MDLNTNEVIGIATIATALFVGVVSWFVSAWNTKRTIKRKELTYKMKLTPLINEDLIKDKHNLKIEYNDHIIDRLVLLELDITNSGNEAIEKPPMRVESRGQCH